MDEYDDGDRDDRRERRWVVNEYDRRDIGGTAEEGDEEEEGTEEGRDEEREEDGVDEAGGDAWRLACEECCGGG